MVLYSLSAAVELLDGAIEFGKFYADNDIGIPVGPSASVANYGKGKIAATYFNFGERYVNGATSIARDFINSLVRELFPLPLVEVRGSHFVDVTVNKIDGRIAVNLVNTAGVHSDTKVYVYDEIPAVGPLEVRIRSAEKPDKVLLEPEGKELAFHFDGEVISFVLQKLTIHEVIVLK